MGLIHWRSSYAINVFQLDQEHKKLVDLINTLYEARKEGQDEAVLRNILSGLIDYTQTHFQHEETEMERLGFPDTEHHKKRHLELKQQVFDLKTMVDQDIEGLSDPVFRFLREWLMEHILEEDKKLGPYLNERGVF